MKQLFVILSVLLLTCCSSDNEAKAQDNQTSDNMTRKMHITINGRTETATLVDNAATQALVARLQEASVTVTLNSSGGFEIWGALGFSLPTSNTQITAQPGDIVFITGATSACYGSNSWSYTRLGKIDGLTESELRTFLKAGESNIYVTLSVGSVSDIQTPKAKNSTKRFFCLNGMCANNPSKGVYIHNGKKIIK